MEILLCKACQTENSADSKFCKICGQALKPETKPLTHEEAEALLEDGFKLVGTGKTEEAAYIASAVLDANPDNPKAHALQGMVHEEKGDLVAALAAFEHVVRLKPESTLDRIKLGQIRRRLETEPLKSDLEVRGRNWLAIGSAAAAMILVSAIGVMLAWPKPIASSAKEGTIYASNEGAQGFSFGDNSAPKNNTQNPGVITSETNTNANNPAPPLQPQDTSPRRPVVSNPMGKLAPWMPNGTYEITPSKNNNNGSTLPEVNGSGTLPTQPKNGNTAPATNNNNGGTMRDPDIVENKKPNPGRIVITESKGGGGNASASDPSVSENIYRVAQQKMATGDYRGAIRDFTTALQGTKRPGLIHQLIGRCYARTGDTGNAKQHFQTALDIYEKSGAKNEAEACRRELDLLG